MYRYFNPNPCGRNTSDCAIRAIAKALGIDWKTAYTMLCEEGREMCELPNANSVWGAVLKKEGFIKRVISCGFPNCYTINEFCEDHPRGTYVLGTGTHVVTAIDGDYFDSWESGEEIPCYYWYRY